MGDTKKIAVIVRERQSDAFRVLCGLTLADDSVDIFVLDRVLDKHAPDMVMMLDVAGELGLHLFSNNPENGCTTISLEEIANRLLEYDIVVPY